MKIFLYSSSLYSYHLFLISSASVRSIPFLSFIEPIFAWNVPLVSLIFLKRSLVFPIFCFPLFLCIDHWGRLSFLSVVFFGILHSNGYIFPFLLCLSLLFFPQLFVRPPQTTILPFCISFSWGWSWSLAHVQCHEPPSIVLQALCLSDLIPWIYLPIPLYKHKGFVRSYLNVLVVFPTFFYLYMYLLLLLPQSSLYEQKSRLFHGVEWTGQLKSISNSTLNGECHQIQLSTLCCPLCSFSLLH